jgi:hypothetical protein
MAPIPRRPPNLPEEASMLSLEADPIGILYQCDRCRTVGELISRIHEEEGTYHCWDCWREVNLMGKRRRNDHAVE